MTEREIFIAALQKESRADREAYLDQACAGQPGLREQVEGLLRLYENADSFLEQPAIKADDNPEIATTAMPAPATEGPGCVIGPYKLLEQIGEGGFGVVYLAEQTEPVRRKVALKILKPGMDTRQIVARFEAERQALAIMDHPNIAKVFDGGSTASASSGRPYFVMELVKGIPITEYCDQNHLTPRQRLELFIPVCQAVQHAHQKGIIHRDLKPSNVLVTRHDSTPVPKVIDFGVAKALGQELTDKTLFTGIAQMIGTPLYMSPEQAGMSDLDVDTRSDIYSLGVLLYELLTGTTPFEKERFKKAAYDEIRRIIREEEPPKPSTRLSDLSRFRLPGEAVDSPARQAGPTSNLASISALRQTEPAKLTKLVRGELDWIVMKCLEKDRNRRYETTNGLAADLLRYLADEPVLACPPSVGYRLRKFVRRNKRLLATASVVILAVLIAIGSILGSVIWRTREGAARRWETERAVATALTEAETLLAEGDKQIDEPERRQATTQLAEKAVERAEELAATGYARNELIHRVHEARAAVNASQSDSQLLIQFDKIRLEKAFAVRGIYFDDARAVVLYKQALQRYGIDLASPAEAAERVRSSRLREKLLNAMEDWGGASENVAEREQIKHLLNAVWSTPDSFRYRWRSAFEKRNVAALVQLANSLEARSLSREEAVKLANALVKVNERSVAERILRSYQEKYPGDFWLNHDLGALLLNQQSEAATRYLTAALALRPESPSVHTNLGAALKAKGDVDGAIREFRVALRIEPNHTMSHANLANALFANKDIDGAIGEYKAAIEIEPAFPQIHTRLGEALLEKKDLKAAIQEFQQAILVAPRDAEAHYGLGLALSDKGDQVAAIREYRSVLRIDPQNAEAHHNLGKVLADTKDFAGAICEYRAALAINDKDALTHVALANALFAINDLDGAIGAFRKAIVVDPKSANGHNGLGFALLTKGDLVSAIPELRTAIAINDKRAIFHLNLGIALFRANDLEQAKQAFQSAIRADVRDFRGHMNLAIVLAAMNDLEGAEREYRETLAINPSVAEARCLLGRTLQREGRFVEAARELKAGHDVGSRRTNWNLASAAWIRETARLVEIDAKLAKVLKREIEPASPLERTELASLCQQPYNQLNSHAVRFYFEAFAADPKLAEDLRTQRRYNAACAAALAGCGQGKDAGDLDEKERARWRRQALTWLQADLAEWRKQFEGNKATLGAPVQQAMAHWLGDTDFAGVRGPMALAKLSETERHDWQKLWQEAEELGKRAAQESKAR